MDEIDRRNRPDVPARAIFPSWFRRATTREALHDYEGADPATGGCLATGNRGDHGRTARPARRRRAAPSTPRRSAPLVGARVTPVGDRRAAAVDRRRPRGTRRCRGPGGTTGHRAGGRGGQPGRPAGAVSYTHLRAHETPEHLVCRLLLEKKK